MRLILAAVLLSGCKVYYDRPRIRQLENDNRILQEKLKECETPAPASSAWWEWWFNS